MQPLTRTDLMSLEQYAAARPRFRAKVLAHKAPRKVHLGDHATLYFEDRLTIQYQIQEMLRIERIFEAESIMEELDAYNPLIPDGSNWKATFMLEYPDMEERKVQLARLIGIERNTWVQVAGFDKVYAIANEDMSRETEEKTAAVHFTRFELSAEMIQAIREKAALYMGTDHPHYTQQVLISDATRAALIADLA